MASKPKTAYGLVMKAARLIRAHRLNYYQDAYAVDRRRADFRTPASVLSEENECGTAFCRAGWIGIAQDGEKALRRRGSDSIANRACRLLGAKITTGAWPWQQAPLERAISDLFEADTVIGEPGTKSYAERGARGLERFAKQFKKHLTKVRVEGK